MLREMAARLPVLPGRLLIGLSGGADSVALLVLLEALGGKRLHAVHVNHGLRGADADGDEAFVRRLCAEKNVPLTVCRLTPPAHAGEGWAREARYGCFREAYAHCGAEALLLAHHQGDQAETVLEHLLRGSGLNGLGGMAADTVLDGMRVLRPLLGFTHEELCGLLTAAGQAWREDGSNAENDYLRNRVRHELLPLMERLAPGAARRIANTAQLLRRDEEALRHLTSERLPEAGQRWLPLREIVELPEALQSRLLRLWWQREAAGLPELSSGQTAQALRLIREKAGARANLPGGWQLQRGWHCLHLLPPVEEAAPPAAVCVNDTAPGAAYRLGGVTLCLAASEGSPGDGLTAQEVPRSLLAGCSLRFRRAGDWLRPFGMEGRKSLQDLLTDRRVDAPFRGRIPLLVRGDEVLMAAGVGCGAVPGYDPEADNVRLHWRGEMPWMTTS